MTAANFNQCLTWILESEGGNDNDPEDHGGRTSRGIKHLGITQREFTAFRKRSSLPDTDVWKASEFEIWVIYHSQYWAPWCDQFPTGIDYIFFDMSILQGPHKAIQLLQRGLGVEDDGHIGIITLNALSQANYVELISLITEKRIKFFHSLQQPRFLRGWLNRAKRVESQAISMIGTTI